ncbi:flavodoxin [Clostridium botulinum A2 117]|uniref:flavodoxin domain-containing protein n=1 Tax=Clostridium botulinum TaxID=1491 RepID=UPI0007E1F040|nr:flavodoxin domain-containing protein [Clostridium botulinum]KEI78484.1 flavodoxin [Clostridium botulinum A2 117]MBN3415689.1 flavodoxin [Clostridium botulinum]MBN3441982.1 flavodoxin [Clostridium botulinum]MBY6806033.1 flavodoxin domain-containing protein [Clostridium botulinum]NFS07523.1 flavodoxin [Clostridium botulinum]
MYNKIAIIYKSKYGSSKKYAQWIAEEVKGDLFNSSNITEEKLKEYDIIVYGGGLYASGISGISLITKNLDILKDKKIIVYTVGLASTDKKEIFIPIIEKNFPKSQREEIKFFHLRGGIDYKKLSLVHKSMMAMLKRVTAKKPEDKLTDEEKEFLGTYGDKVDFTDKSTIIPLVNYINNSI